MDLKKFLDSTPSSQYLDPMLVKVPAAVVLFHCQPPLTSYISIVQGLKTLFLLNRTFRTHRAEAQNMFRHYTNINDKNITFNQSNQSRTFPDDKLI